MHLTPRFAPPTLLRMGTHPSGPAVIAGSGETLSAWLGEHPEALGDATRARFGGELPYLFKVRRAPNVSYDQ